MMRVRWLPFTDQTWPRGNKFQMSFIPKPLRVCDRELAHVDTLGLLIGFFRNKWRSDSRTFFPKLFGQGNVMSTPVIPRWTRNRSCVIWVKAKPLRTGSNCVNHPLGVRL